MNGSACSNDFSSEQRYKTFKSCRTWWDVNIIQADDILVSRDFWVKNATFRKSCTPHIDRVKIWDYLVMLWQVRRYTYWKIYIHTRILPTKAASGEFVREGERFQCIFTSSKVYICNLRDCDNRNDTIQYGNM
jgi:hypothetical protein